MDRFDAIALVLRYKQHVMEKGLAENTVNRRLAAIRSLVNYARTVGKCDWTLADVKWVLYYLSGRELQTEASLVPSSSGSSVAG